MTYSNLAMQASVQAQHNQSSPQIEGPRIAGSSVSLNQTLNNELMAKQQNQNNPYSQYFSKRKEKQKMN